MVNHVVIGFTYVTDSPLVTVIELSDYDTHSLALSRSAL
jgi:hypothetical protein